MLIYFQDHDISFLSFFFFSLFTLYLLFCVLKGNFQFGVRIFCCFAVHPMEKGKTYMNSFLFNISLVLLGSMAITQFVTDCLSDYVAFTDVDALFNTLIKNLKFFKYFYRNHVFQYLFFCVFVLSLLYMIWQLCKAKKSINDKSGIELEKNKNKKKKKENIKVEEKLKKKNSKKNSKSDKETENSDSFGKLKKNKIKNSSDDNVNEEKLDDDNNENNINNESNSFENDI
jgi:LMBR1 domain-containing protein 1